MMEKVLKLNPDGYALCLSNKKKATLRLGSREVGGSLELENTDTGERVEVTVTSKREMRAGDAYLDKEVLKLLGYLNNPGKLAVMMKKHYLEITDDSLVTLISWE